MADALDLGSSTERCQGSSPCEPIFFGEQNKINADMEEEERMNMKNIANLLIKKDLKN